MVHFSSAFYKCGLIPGREEVAKVVRSKSKLAVMVLTAIIEWFTQLHYIEHMRDDSDLDGLFRDLLRFHWMEEAQHAKLDTLLIGEVAEHLTLEDREKAIDEVLELGGAIDGLLAQQIELNIEALENVTGGRSRLPRRRRSRRRRSGRGGGPSSYLDWSTRTSSKRSVS